MKLVTIECREVSGRPGVLVDDDWILDLVAAPGTMSESQWVPLSVVSILAAGAEGRSRTRRLVNAALDSDAARRAELRESGALLPAADTALMPSLRRPGLVLMSSADATEDASRALCWARNPNAVVGDGVRVQVPWSSDKGVAVSAMPAAIFGKPLYAAGADEAEQAIAAWTMLLDFSRADLDPLADAESWQLHVQSRQFPGACPIGPLVTVDEVPDPGSLTANLVVNGVDAGAAALFEAPTAWAGRLAKLTHYHGFRPGDLVAFEPAPDSALAGCRLRGGDRVQVSAPGFCGVSAVVNFPHDE